MRAIRNLILLLAVLAPVAARAETAPAWKMSVRLGDGRTFVTDGSITLDAALVKPKTMPKEVKADAAARMIEKGLAAPATNEFDLAKLTANRRGQAYVAPNGISIAIRYVDYVASTAGSDVRFRVQGELEPVAIVVDGKGVGLVMPMRR